MSTIDIDISDEDDDGAAVEITPDVLGAYEISIGDLKLTVSYAQMERIYRQTRPWFEESPT